MMFSSLGMLGATYNVFNLMMGSLGITPKAEKYLYVAVRSHKKPREFCGLCFPFLADGNQGRNDWKRWPCSPAPFRQRWFYVHLSPLGLPRLSSRYPRPRKPLSPLVWCEASRNTEKLFQELSRGTLGRWVWFDWGKPTIASGREGQGSRAF